jgi:hypothetical protein
VIDRKFIGHKIEPYTVEVECGRLRFFAKAIGEKNPVYTGEAGPIPIPPTYLFSLENEVPEPFGWLTSMGVHLGNELHGEQSFQYHRMVYAGDKVTFEPRIADIYDKKNGALEFVVKETLVKNAAGEMVAELRAVLVVRHGK